MESTAPSTRIRSHRDLVVWNKAVDLTLLIYDLTAKFPSNEIYSLVAQMRRSASSIPANIAEGHARGTQRDYCQFLAIAKGSLMETQTFILLALRLGYVQESEAAPALALITEVSKMLTVLRARLKHWE
jgi:four helix bundle protein